MPRQATISQADISRAMRALIALGYEPMVEIGNGVVRVIPYQQPAQAVKLDNSKGVPL